MGNNIIEINGKRYDARSGSYLGDGVKSAIQRQRTTGHRGRVIDGFVKPNSITPKPITGSPQVAQTHAQLGRAPRATSVAPIKVAKKQVVQRTPASSASAHKPEKAKTLMRTVVHKPKKMSLKPVLKAQGKSEVAAAPVSDLVPSLKLSAQNVDARRLARARQAIQNNRVTRFTSLQQNHPVNARGQVRAATAQPHTTRGPGQHGTTSQPAHNTAHNTQPQQSSHHTQRSADLFEAAVANARSHEQPQAKLKKSGRQKLISIGASLAAVAVIVGFIGYTNMSSIEMRVASVRAGFSAQLPGYAPSGYAINGGIKAAQGVVATTYRSGDSSYTLQQQQSDWDSQTLYDNVVAVSGDKHQTVQTQGRTIYIYGNKAAWVNGGVLYNIASDGAINNQEITAIATSM